MIKPLLLVSLGLISSNVYAITKPYPQKSDTRIVSAKYDPSNVILVKTKVGVATLIQLDKNETLSGDHSGLGMGDATAWGFNVRGHNIFFKPQAKRPDTNLTIVSDLGRTYSFELITSPSPYYIVKMEYEKPKKRNTSPKLPCSDGTINWKYIKWGDDELSPQYTWDDGRFTCMKFAKNAELPVVYQITSDGKESLVNYHIERDTVVIQSVVNEYRLRLGDSVLGIYSNTEFAGYNDKGSSIKAKRVIKDESNG